MDMYQKRKERKKAKSSESVTENTSSINWYKPTYGKLLLFKDIY